jgi:RNA 3'-terminal phosphate cyclase
MEFFGSQNFRSRIICSLLSSEAIVLKNFKSPFGIEPFEAKYLELVSLITNGSIVNISTSGCKVRFTPGLITNADYSIELDCTDSGRGLAYYLEGIIPITLFGKCSLELTLSGEIQDHRDISIDSLKSALVPLIYRFGEEI